MAHFWPLKTLPPDIMVLHNQILLFSSILIKLNQVEAVQCLLFSEIGFLGDTFNKNGDFIFQANQDIS